MQNFTHLKERLYCPGPTPISEAARRAGSGPAKYHRTPEFGKTLESCRQKLAPLFGTTQLPIVLTASGTGAMEAAVANLTDVGDKVLVVESGKFGNRWFQLNEAFKCKVVRLQFPWGGTYAPGEIAQTLKENPGIKSVFVQANETSTGVHHDIKLLASEIRSQSSETLIVVDAISSICAHEMQMDAWDLDCVISGSQKGFGVPPGLAFAALSDRAIKNLSSRPKFYFDLAKEKKGQDDGKTAWTPANGLIDMLDAALDQICSEGFESVIEHHAKIAAAARKATQSIGLELLPKSHYSNSLTAILLEKDELAPRVLKRLKNQFKMIFAGGQDELKGRIVRFAHLGYYDFFDSVAGLSGLEMALHLEGFGNQLGKATGVFMKEYLEPTS